MTRHVTLVQTQGKRLGVWSRRRSHLSGQRALSEGRRGARVWDCVDQLLTALLFAGGNEKGGGANEILLSGLSGPWLIRFDRCLITAQSII